MVEDITTFCVFTSVTFNSPAPSQHLQLDILSSFLDDKGSIL